MKTFKKTLVSLAHFNSTFVPCADPFPFLLQLRKSSQDSNSSKKESKSTSSSSNAAPPVPPNTAKPLPTPGGSGSTNHLNPSNHIVPSQSPSQSPSSSHRSSSPVSSGLATSDRRSSADNGAPAPPIVVVSSEAPSEAPLRAGHFNGTPERHSLLDHGNATPPRATTLNRLRAGPKDTIPMVGKPPRKQRSSRFVVTEKVDIERLPPFMGTF